MFYKSTLVSFDSLEFSNDNPKISIVGNHNLSTSSFDPAYKLIECSNIEPVQLTLSGENYELLTNGEGRYSDSLGGIFTDDNNQQWAIAGHFLICRINSDFELTQEEQPPTAEIIKLLEKHYQPAKIPEIA